MGEKIDTFVLCALLVFFSVFSISSTVDSKSFIYEVKEGDTLYEIAIQFGDYRWWKEIYFANQDKIANPKFIYPGQRLTIPSHIVKKYQTSLEGVDFNELFAITRQYSFSGKDSEEDDRLEKFREAFNRVLDREENPASKQIKKQKGQSGQGMGLALEGMVLDETRSKMGSNFYSIFYNHWEAPENAQNFTITISEQPVPSRGTMVQIKIDDRLVFKNRLEPRYYKTEQAAKRAVKVCQKSLQQQASIQQNQVTGY